MHTLEADSIILNFGGRPILSDVYLKCVTGEILGIVGRNGCGKSSLLKIIFGSLKGENQSVRFDTTYTSCLFTQLHAVKYLPQSGLLPNRIKVKTAIRICVPDSEMQNLISTFAEIKPHLEMRVGTLSGGIKRFLEIVLLMYSDAHFVLLDEPFSHLSPVLIESLHPKMRAQAQHKGIIITDHYYRHVLELSSRLLLLQKGKTHRISQEQQLVDLGYLPVQKAGNSV